MKTDLNTADAAHTHTHACVKRICITPVPTSAAVASGNREAASSNRSHALHVQSLVHCAYDTIHDTRCYINVRSKADTSQLNLPHRTKN